MSDQRMIWCDVETTGLEPGRDLLLEIGFVETNLDNEIVDEFEVQIFNPEWEPLLTEERLDPFIWDMHTKSNLLEELPIKGVSEVRAEELVFEWLLGRGVGKTDPLCGSSVQFDRSWLTTWQPDNMDLFSYRNIDISTLKELMLRLSPDFYKEFHDEWKANNVSRHRILDDLRDTIEEFKFYRKEFLYVPRDFA